MDEIKGPHDVGGEHGDGIDIVNHGMTHWEKHANALRMVIAGKRICTLDELRRACEDLGGRYDEISYFERQGEALAIVLMEKGIITEAGLNARMDEINKRFDVPIIPLPEHHDHDGKPIQEDETGEGPNHHHVMNLAVQELLQEQGLVAADELRNMIENFDDEYPHRGAKVVVRAWTDEDYRARLLSDAAPAIAEMGIDLLHQADIIALENTADTHNVIVCTLCSCYPRFLLGQPPTWYKSRSYRSRVVYEPRAVLKEFGTTLPGDIAIKVHDSNANMRYIVIPLRPAGTENWSHDQLEAIISRDCLVGVAVPTIEDGGNDGETSESA